MSEKLQQLAEFWIGYKTRLVEYLGMTDDSLHVHGSLLILFVSAILLRRRADSLWCWIIVLIAELFNEFADLKGLAPGEDSIDASLHDIYITMFWPTILVIFGRIVFPSRMSAPVIKKQSSGEFADQSFEQPPAI